MFLLGFLMLFIPQRFSMKKSAAIYALIWGVLSGSFLFRSICIPERYFLQLVINAAEIVVFQGSAFFMSRERNSKVVFLSLCASNYCLTGGIASAIGFTLFHSAVIALLAELAVLVFLLVFLALRFRKAYLGLFEDKIDGWEKLWIIPVLFWISFFFLALFPVSLHDNPQNIPAAFLSVLTMVVSYGLVIKYIENKAEKEAVFWGNEMFELCSREMTERYHNVAEAEHQLKVLRHDLHHYTQMIYTMAEQRNWDGVQNMVRELNDIIEDTRVEVYCENPVVNSILSSYIKRAAAVGVSVQADIHIPEELPFSSIELACVLANLLENAIHSVQKNEEKDKRVEMLVRYRDGRLILEVKNPFFGDLDFDGESMLPLSRRGKGHGLGLQSVKAFCEKNGVNFDCYCEENVFTVRMLADLL